MREIQSHAQAPSAAGFHQFLDDVPFERGFHDAVGQVAILDLARPRPRVNEALLDPGFRIEHGKPVVVLGGESKILQPRARHHPGPLIGVEINRIEALVELVVLFAERRIVPPRQLPRRLLVEHRVHAPVDAQAVLHVVPSFNRLG